MMGMFPVANHPAVILFDSGASHSFINRTFVVKYEISIGTTKENLFVQSPGGRLVFARAKMCGHLPLVCFIKRPLGEPQASFPQFPVTKKLVRRLLRGQTFPLLLILVC